MVKFSSVPSSLSFDDVLILPKAKSRVKSRLDTDIKAKISRNFAVSTPFLASPMDRVVGMQSAQALVGAGASVCFHRFQDWELQLTSSTMIKSVFPNAIIINAISAQLDNQYELSRINSLAKISNIFIVDTAMGTNQRVLDAIKYLKDFYPGIDIIAGNVVTPEGCQALIEAGADGIRAGIGNGSGCLTRTQTGVGRGQLTTILECAPVCKEAGVSLISDGGHYKPGDANKAIAAGADIVMMGSPLAGHIESPSETFYLYKGHYFAEDEQIFIEGLGLKNVSSVPGLPKYKEYRGMASKEAQEDWKGMKPGTTFEGIQKFVKLKGKVEKTIEMYVGGLRSSMTYVDSTTLDEYRENVVFELLSPSSQRESYDR
jgi:IMP dehydrogenase